MESYDSTLLLIIILLWKFREWFIPNCDRVTQNLEASDPLFFVAVCRLKLCCGGLWIDLVQF
jgi:hypothetical protein